MENIEEGNEEENSANLTAAEKLMRSEALIERNDESTGLIDTSKNSKAPPSKNKHKKGHESEIEMETLEDSKL